MANDTEKRLWEEVVGAFRSARSTRGYDPRVTGGGGVGVRRQVANARANAFLEAFCIVTGEDPEAAHDAVTDALQAEYERAIAETWG